MTDRIDRLPASAVREHDHGLDAARYRLEVERRTKAALAVLFRPVPRPVVPR